MENPDDWVAVNWTLPIVVAVVASVVVPAVIALIGTIGKGVASARQLRLELVRDFIRATAEYEAAFQRDRLEFSESSEEALQTGAKRFVGYPKHQIGAEAAVRTSWRSILAQTTNLSRNSTQRGKQLELFTRSLDFMNKLSWKFDDRNVEHFPDVLGTWTRWGRMDFSRLEENLKTIASTPPSKNDG